MSLMTHESIHEMIQETALRQGDRPAIEWEEQRVTYRQLEDRSTEIAAALLGAGIAPGSLVAILSPMTADVVASILGILKAGSAFVPFDLDFPSVRLEAAIEQVKPHCWLVDEGGVLELEQRLSAAGLSATVLPLRSAWRETPRAAGEVAAAPRLPFPPDGLSSVFFTSGSSGRPKAIAGRFKAIGHFIKWHRETFGVGEDSRVCQLTSFAFDGFLHEALLPLAAGGTLCVSSHRETILDGARLVEWIDRERITLIHCTPSLFRSILNQELRPSQFASLRHIFLAGEAVLPSDVKRLHSVFGSRIQLVNLYGPTETTLTKLVYVVKPEDAEGRVVPIGQPMDGARAIVVDDRGQPCPPGKLGEIYIRTPYRALGYLDAPELTAKVFIQNPFSDNPDDIVYKTGDLGRLRDDGDLEFVGRRDQQVKVRGVRVEIAPIEDLLSVHPAVLEVAVIDRLDVHGNKFLAAYLVLKEPVSPELLSNLLLARLPASSVPSVFIVLEQLPRTLSGKVDRRALPEPTEASGRLAREYVAPRTPIEERLCAIFSELLRVPKVGAHDHFFELGGHSLLVMQLLAKTRAAFLPVPLGLVFQAPTVEGLAMEITRLQLEQAEQRRVDELLTQIEAMPETTVEEQLGEGGA